ncbi:MAG: hypothetical protein JRH20_26470, partial [Deltaproteobacteria bacterium]|nr:hypothetical protein [Deltaproteobacteria bacterium]
MRRITRTLVVVLFLAGVATGCGDDSGVALDGPTPTSEFSVDGQQPTDGGVADMADMAPPADLGAPVTLAARQNLVEGHFATSANCQTCHG